jgi:hypothetical protein
VMALVGLLYDCLKLKHSGTRDRGYFNLTMAARTRQNCPITIDSGAYGSQRSIGYI